MKIATPPTDAPPPPEKSQASPFLKIWLQAQPSMYMYFFLLAQATEMAAKFAK